MSIVVEGTVKVYTLEAGNDGYDASIKGVFVTEELAEKFFEEKLSEKHYWHLVTEWELEGY